MGKKGGKFKTRKFFNYPESFLYLIYSRKGVDLLDMNVMQSDKHDSIRRITISKLKHSTINCENLAIFRRICHLINCTFSHNEQLRIKNPSLSHPFFNNAQINCNKTYKITFNQSSTFIIYRFNQNKPSGV